MMHILPSAVEKNKRLALEEVPVSVSVNHDYLFCTVFKLRLQDQEFVGKFYKLFSDVLLLKRINQTKHYLSINAQSNFFSSETNYRLSICRIISSHFAHQIISQTNHF